MNQLNANRWLRPVYASVALVALMLVGLSTPAASLSSPIRAPEVRSLTPAQKKAKAREMAKCRKIKSKSRRDACVKKVNKKYAPKPGSGKTWQVGLWDNYYQPDSLKLKVNDSINWTWQEQNGREAHDVGLLSGPKGVSPYDFLSNTTALFGTTFKRRFKTPGDYSFICSLHYQMTMQVKVTR